MTSKTLKPHARGKMTVDLKKEEPCEICSKDTDFFCQHWVEREDDLEDHWEEVENVRYCPNCGRKLIGEK